MLIPPVMTGIAPSLGVSHVMLTATILKEREGNVKRVGSDGNRVMSPLPCSAASDKGASPERSCLVSSLPHI